MPRVFAALSVLAAGVLAASALTLTGSVKNEAGQGLSNVDIDLIDLCTNQSVFLVNDKTAADGTYNVTVNPGTYDVRYTPPSGSTVAAWEAKDVAINANTNLGVTVLHPGRLVSGHVQNTSGAALSGVDLRFLDPLTGDKIYYTNVPTSATGDYSVRVRPGTYELDFRPPSTTTYADRKRTNLVVGTTDVTGLVDALATGLNVFGTVQDKRKNPQQYGSVTVYDVCTGDKVQTSHNLIDATGKFSLYLPVGTYSIYVNPPHCSTSIGAQRFADTVVDRNTDLKTIVLPDAFPVSVQVVDAQGVPVPDVHVKFYDAAKNTRVIAPHDHTDANGNATAYVPTDNYFVNLEPPAGRTLLVGHLNGVSVSGPTSLGTVVLAAGVPVSGRLTGPGGTGVLNANVNAVDAVTRAPARLAHDATAADGTFTVVIPPGTYDFQYGPAACTNLAPADQKAVTIAGTTTLPTLPLVAGVHATGHVQDDLAAAVASVDVRFFTPGTRTRWYTPGNASDAAGNYDVFVQPRAYDIDYIPNATSGLRPAKRLNVSVLANTTIPAVTLVHGPTVSGFVKAQATLLAVPDTAVDFYAPGASTPLFVGYNTTASDGSYHVVVDAGTWDVLFTPPAASGLAPQWRRGTVVGTDLPLADALLLPLTVPTVSTVAPASGSTAGGTAVTVTGAGFQSDAVVKIGGVTAKNVVVVSATSITATAPPHPAGRQDVSVVNPGAQVGTLAAAFTYNDPATPPRLTVTKSGANVVLTWTTTGQPNYTVFRNGAATGFGDGSILGTTAAATWTDGGSPSTPGSVSFYVVD